jgi:hypothetical protein
MCIGGHKPVSCLIFSKKTSRYACEVIWTKVFSCQRFRKYLQKPVFSFPSKNIDNVKNNSVAFEFKSDITFNTLCILDISSLNARSADKLSMNIYVGSRARLPVSSSFSVRFSLKTRKILYCLPCDSNFKTSTVWFKLQTSDFQDYTWTARARRQSCSDLYI